MSYEYPHFLDPDLYSNGRVARFIDELISPEIISLSEEMLDDYNQTLPSIDDIIEQIDQIEEMSQNRIKETARFDPFFVAFCSPSKLVKLTSTTPTTESGVRSLLMLGKCLAFTNKTQSIFFATEMHHKDGEPVFGEEVPKDASWGIYIVGSSVRGNSFLSLTDITTTDFGFEFHQLKKEVGRDLRSSIPFSRFFYIKDEEELTEIVEQLHTINMRLPPTHERDPLINFAIILNALRAHNYLS